MTLRFENYLSMYRPAHLSPQHQRLPWWNHPYFRLAISLLIVLVIAAFSILNHLHKQNLEYQQALAQAWKKSTPHSVILSANGKKDLHATATQIRSWIKMQPDRSGSKLRFTPYFQRKPLTNWIQKSAKYFNISPRNGAREVDKSGHLVRLVRDPVNGLKVTKIPESANELLTALRQGKQKIKILLKTIPANGGFDETIVPSPPLPYQPEPQQRWVDVNLKNHTTAVYQGNQPIFGPVATIDGHPKGPTKQGVFQVYLKNPQQVMRGIGWDGPYSETAPWIAYFNGDYALHGAPWRNTFVWDPSKGSHGCINMKPDEAKQVYDLVDIGTTVVVHE